MTSAQRERRRRWLYQRSKQSRSSRQLCKTGRKGRAWRSEGRRVRARVRVRVPKHTSEGKHQVLNTWSPRGVLTPIWPAARMARTEVQPADKLSTKPRRRLTCRGGDPDSLLSSTRDCHTLMQLRLECNSLSRRAPRGSIRAVALQATQDSSTTAGIL